MSIEDDIDEIDTDTDTDLDEDQEEIDTDQDEEQDEDQDEDGGEDDGDDDGEPSDEELERVAKGDGLIPRKRLNQVNAKLQQEREQRIIAETELRILKESGASKKGAEDKAKAEPEFDEDKAQEEYMAAVLEGDSDKAKAIFKAMTLNMSTKAVKQAKEAAQELIDESREQDRVERETKRIATAVGRVLNDIPELDPKHKNHNKDLFETFALHRDALMNRGESQADAIKQAHVKVRALLKPSGGKQRSTDTDDDIEAKRRALRQARRIPPSTIRSGSSTRESGTGTPDIEKMTSSQRMKYLRSLG